MFTNRFTTNGYQASFHFARASKNASVDLELDDFCADEIESYFRPCAIDPGRQHIFQAAYGTGSDQHELRRCSTKEYYQLTGSLQRKKKLQAAKKRNGIEYIESNFPTAKTSNIEQYKEYVQYFFWHLPRLLEFYNFDNDTERRFHDYQGRQRAREEMVNIIVNGGKKVQSGKEKEKEQKRSVLEGPKKKKENYLIASLLNSK